MKAYSWSSPHMRQSRRNLLRSMYFAAGVFALLFVVFHIAASLYVSRLAVISRERFEMGIEKDTSHLKREGDAVAKNPLIMEYLESGEYSKLPELIQAEREKRAIGLMGIADENGVIVGRTKSSNRLGENAYLTTPVGRVIQTGNSIESIEAVYGFDPRQVFMTTGRPIKHGDTQIGGLFSNYLLNDEYATRFQSEYLPSGVHVVFYRKSVGVFGSGFSDPKIRSLVNSYFNSGSDWLRGEGSGKTVAFNDGKYYLVENIVFPGLESSPGGALLFIPRSEVSPLASAVSVAFALLAFIVFALTSHFKSRTEEVGWRYYFQLFLACILVISLALGFLSLRNQGTLQLEHVPYILYNSTIRLQPESGIYDENFERRFTIYVDTGDEKINAVQTKLLFDPSAVNFMKLETASSSCSFIIENRIDRELGEADLSCVILGDESGARSFPIADVLLVPKRPGTFDLSFDPSGTRVLAGDGLGTDVLRAAQSGSYRVDSFNSALDSSATSTGRTFVIFSPTHPNQSRWYNSDVARFVWIGKPGQAYRYAFNTEPDTVSFDKNTFLGNSLSLPVSGDGIFYFHLQLASGGPIAHYKIRVDRTPPIIDSLSMSSDRVVAGDVVRFSFKARDIGSGVQNNYYIDFGNHPFLPVGSELLVPFIRPGNHPVTLRVYDGADNFTEESKIVHVEEK